MIAADNIKWERIGVLSAFVALILSAVGFAFAPIPPSISSSTEEITKYFADNSQGILVQSYMLQLASAAFLWFIFSLRSYMRRIEDEPGRLSAAALGAGVVGLTVGTIGTLFPVVLARRAALLDTATMKTLYDLGAVSGPISNVPFALMFAAVGLLALHRRAFPAWLGRVSLLGALLHLVVGSGFIFDEGPLSPGGLLTNAAGGVFALWLIATTVVIYRRLGRLPVESSNPVAAGTPRS